MKIFSSEGRALSFLAPSLVMGNGSVVSSILCASVPQTPDTLAGTMLWVLLVCVHE